MTAPVWPSVADRTCQACRTPHVECTWFADGWLLCAECQEMPSRVEQYRTSKETR